MTVKINATNIAAGEAMLNTRLRYLLIFLTALAIVTVHHVQKQIFRPRLENMVLYENYYEDARNPDVTCQFPILHPFHPSILEHISVAKPISCFARQKLLTRIDDDGILRFNKTGLVEAGYDPSADSLQCYYQEITRVPDDDFNIEYGPQIQMSGYDRPTSDFVYVECVNFANIAVYKNYHAHAQRQPSVRKFKNDHELGAVIIGIDSMSRLNFMRQLPQSYRLITDEMNGVVLLGFNKVGENTFPNVVPILTGRPLPCSGEFNYFEGWPFVWNDFEEQGAATMYSEDLPEFNMFDYLDSGIRKQPTLHYMRTYWIAVENSLLYKMSSSFCLGPTPKHLIYLNYLKSFLYTYRDSPVFLFSLFNEASHDYVNTVGAIDKDLFEFLNSSYRENLFNRSVVFVLGDHGNRIDPIRLTDVGRVEDRMPMVTVIMPDWAEQVYPQWKEALQENSRRLLSSYDIHATCLDILSTLKHYSPDKTQTNSVEADSRNMLNTERAIKNGLKGSLLKHFTERRLGTSFFELVPVTRDCDSAGIPEWFCVCQTNEERISPEDPRSINAAKAVVSHFNNNLLQGLTEFCAVQKLVTVDSATLILHKDKTDEYRIQVMFRTQPGDGVFEAHVNVYENSNNNVDYKIVGEMLRINRYGDMASCLPRTLLANSTILRGICYCKS